MSAFIANHTDASKQALQQIFRQPIGSLLTVLMLGIALVLPLIFFLGVQSVHPILGKLSADPQIIVIMDNSADSVSINTVEQKIKENSRIKSYQFVSKDNALQQLKSDLGEANLVNMLDTNPLPDEFIVIPNTTNHKEIKQLQKDLSILPMVDSSNTDTDWVRTLVNVRSFLLHTLWVLAIILGLAFILVAYNTIRLQTLTQKDEIEITKLLGAESVFIRRPFLYHAFFQGIFALIISLGICLVITLYSAPQFSKLFKSYGIFLEWRYFNWQELLIVIFLVILLTVSGAWLATSRHLREFRSK